MSDAGARFAKNAGAVFALKYHLVFCPKYRRPVLTGAVADRLRELIAEVAERREMTVLAAEVMPDHVHLFVESDPRWAPAEIAGKFKAVTSRALREEFAVLRSRLPTLWSPRRDRFPGSSPAVSRAGVPPPRR